MELIKSIFWEMPADMWSEGIFGKLISLLWFILIAFLTALLAWLIFAGLDGAFLSYQPGEAKVVAKRFDPAHSETYMQPMLVGKTTIMIPQTISYPDRYFLDLEINSLIGEKQVEKSSYEEIKEETIIKVQYSKHRMTNNISFE